MHAITKPIILIGFKNVGKTVIGSALASQLNLPFIDLDAEIERMFADANQRQLTCRQIMEAYDEVYFRELETKILTPILQTVVAVIALGGGTPIAHNNQKLIKNHTVIHVEAERNTVFARIMLQGRPAFFTESEDMLVALNSLWDERSKIYKKLATFSIINDGAIVLAVEQILQYLCIN